MRGASPCSLCRSCHALHNGDWQYFKPSWSSLDEGTKACGTLNKCGCKRPVLELQVLRSHTSVHYPFVSVLWVACMSNWRICPPGVHIFIWQYKYNHLLQYSMSWSAAIHTHVSHKKINKICLNSNNSRNFSHLSTISRYFKWLQTLT